MSSLRDKIEAEEKERLEKLAEEVELAEEAKLAEKAVEVKNKPRKKKK